jgi:hypothetical protein
MSFSRSSSTSTFFPSVMNAFLQAVFRSFFCVDSCLPVTKSVANVARVKGRVCVLSFVSIVKLSTFDR